MIKKVSEKQTNLPQSYELLEQKTSASHSPIVLKTLFTLLNQEGFIDERWYREHRNLQEQWYPKSLAVLLKYRRFEAVPESEFAAVLPNGVVCLLNAFVWHEKRFIKNNYFCNLMDSAVIVDQLNKSLQALQLQVKAVNCTEVAGTSYDLHLQIQLTEKSYSVVFTPNNSSWPPLVCQLIQQIMFEQTGLLTLHVVNGPEKSLVFISAELALALEHFGLVSIHKQRNLIARWLSSVGVYRR